MNLPSKTDVLIAGGGIAGSAAAAALVEFGYRILIIEPGLDGSRRLAGELIHPPGATALAELGLLSALEQAGGVPVAGFAVSLTPDSPACMLPYAEIPGCKEQGLAIEHAALRTRLLQAVERLKGVEVCWGGRIVAIDNSSPHSVIATVARDGRQSKIQARMLVGADGGGSKVSLMAGIGRRRSRISNMLGFLVGECPLPYPGFGNVFLGGPAPVLAYEISPGVSRVMFDLPQAPDGIPPTERHNAYVLAIPEPFRSAVQNSLTSRKNLTSANYSFIPDAVVKNRLVLVGDAGGCCHPLTATGLSISAHDGLRLRNCLRECEANIPAALARYAALRKRPQHTRMVLAQTLYETFRAQTPEMRLMRMGLLRYWTNSPEGRAASMALLSTRDTRTSMVALQYIAVLFYALGELFRCGDEQGRKTIRARSRVVLDMSRATMTYATQAFKAW